MRTLICLTCSAALVTIGACASTTPHLDSQMGRAVGTAKAQQTIKPSASANRDPVAGIDGNAANEAIDNYATSFKAPPPPVFNVFNLGR